MPCSLRSLPLGLVLLALVAAAAAAAAPIAEVPWRDGVDIEAALEEAAMEDKRVMVYMTASWCGPCKKLSREVFDSEYGSTLERSFVSLKVDSDSEEGRAIKERHRVNRLPTVFVLRPDGAEAGRIVGYPGAGHFKRSLDRLRPDGDDDGGGSPFDPTF